MAGNLLTVLDAHQPRPDDAAGARMQLRRLANRHGCHPDRCPHQGKRPGCTVHDDDVAYLHEWYQMCGLEPYEAKPETGFVPGGRASGKARAQQGEVA